MLAEERKKKKEEEEEKEKEEEEKEKEEGEEEGGGAEEEKEKFVQMAFPSNSIFYVAGVIRTTESLERRLIESDSDRRKVKIW
ncbi:hypothetical protein M8J77_023573 [Diaphorina citri]|nr:hypothetical protein M8J77_023573 [Diaphorina citri]